MHTFRAVALLAIAASSTVVAQLNLGSILDAVIIPGSTALIDIGAILGVLAPADCAANSVVGLQASAILGSLLRVCLCVEVIGNSNPLEAACPACVANSTPGCNTAAGSCVCVCDAGFSASATGTCEPINASGVARRRRSQLLLAAESERINTMSYSSERCPDNETACPLGRGDGFECVDTTTALDSCGGCPTLGGVNCMALPGALNMECVASQCEIGSCFPGWRLTSLGRCIKATF